VRALVVAVALLALAGCSGSDDPEGSPPPSSSSPSLLPLDEPTFTGAPDGVTVTEVGDGPVGLAAVGDQVWAALPTAGEVRTGDDTRIAVGAAPLRLVATPGAVWVSVISDGTVVRIDRRSGAVDTTAVLRPGGSEPEGLAFDGRRLWVVDQAHDRVLALDPVTGRQLAEVPTGDAPRLVTAGASGVWVSDYGAGAVTRVTPAPVNGPFGGELFRSSSRNLGARCTSPQGLAEAAGVLWVACTVESRVVGLDVRTRKVVTTFDDVGTAAAVVADGDTVYVVGQAGPTVWAIDARARTIGDPMVLDELGGVTENVDGAGVGDHLVVSHPNGLRLYAVPLDLFG
jgi:streptogramin lyase